MRPPCSGPGTVESWLILALSSHLEEGETWGKLMIPLTPAMCLIDAASVFVCVSRSVVSDSL